VRVVRDPAEGRAASARRQHDVFASMGQEAGCEGAPLSAASMVSRELLRNAAADVTCFTVYRPPR